MTRLLPRTRATSYRGGRTRPPRRHHASGSLMLWRPACRVVRSNTASNISSMWSASWRKERGVGRNIMCLRKNTRGSPRPQLRRKNSRFTV